MTNTSDGDQLVLCRARLLRRTGLYEIVVQKGRLASIRESAELAPTARDIAQAHLGDRSWWDVGGRLVLPGLVDAHTHLDKALTLAYASNSTGTLAGAIESFQAYRPRLTAGDVSARAVRLARRLLAFGTTTIRTHIDGGQGDDRVTREVLQGIYDAQQQLAGLVDLQVVLMCPRTQVADMVRWLDSPLAEQIVALGGAPHLADDPERNLAAIVELARQYGLGVDLHIDEQLNPNARTLEQLARAVLARPLAKPVIAGHLVSLDAMDPKTSQAVIKLVAEAKIGAITLPATNLYLQAREDTVGVRRGVTRIRALLQAGVLVAAASDNIQDAFHPFGRGDLLETALLTAYAGHFGEADAETLLGMISENPGRLVKDPHYAIAVGQSADLVVLDARSALEALQELPAARWVFKAGRLVSARRLDTEQKEAGDRG
jgi:cytosine deaminase